MLLSGVLLSGVLLPGIGLFIDNLMSVMRRELAWETDYLREAQCCSKFGYVSTWPDLLVLVFI